MTAPASPLPSGPRMPDLMTEQDVRVEIAMRCRVAGSQPAWAIREGLSPAYVNDVLQGHRQPGKSILAALGYQKVVAYRVPPQPTDVTP